MISPFSDVSKSIQADSEVVVPVANVSGLLGRNARLPCDTTPPSRDNPLLLVIWFKEPSPDPIYRYVVSDKYIGVLDVIDSSIFRYLKIEKSNVKVVIFGLEKWQNSVTSTKKTKLLVRQSNR